VLSVCPICSHGDETLFHTFMQCDHALLFREEAAIYFNIKQTKLNPLTWYTDLLNNSVVKKVAAVGDLA
jgi:hypothetical protein